MFYPAWKREQLPAGRAARVPPAPAAARGCAGAGTCKERVYQLDRAGSKRFPCLRQAEQEGGSGAGPGGSALPVAGFAVLWGLCHAVVGTPGSCAQRAPGSWGTGGVGSGQAQLPVGLARVQGWGRSSSPSRAGASATTDPLAVGLARVASGQACPNLQPWSPNNSRARKGRFMTSLTLQIDESDGEGFLLHSQALKNPVGSQSLEALLLWPCPSVIIMPRLRREGAAGAGCAEGHFCTSFCLGRV